jgi:hypothetical protein
MPSLLSFLLITSALAAQALGPPALLSQSSPQPNRQGTADLGMSQGVRVGPGLNAANAGDSSYHNGAAPHRLKKEKRMVIPNVTLMVLASGCRRRNRYSPELSTSGIGP